MDWVESIGTYLMAKHDDGQIHWIDKSYIEEAVAKRFGLDYTDPGDNRTIRVRSHEVFVWMTQQPTCTLELGNP